MAGGENLSEKNKKLRIELIDKVKTLRGELHSIEDERRALSTQFGETLESLKKKVSNNCLKYTHIYISFSFHLVYSLLCSALLC